jgi:CRISPR-associated protein Cas1
LPLFQTHPQNPWLFLTKVEVPGNIVKIMTSSKHQGEIAPESLFEQVAALGSLWRAWEKVEANHGAAGGDGVSIAQFRAGAAASLKRLSRDLLGGHYAPGPARRVYIPKASGGLRPLDIPCIADRVAQASANLALTPVLDPEFEDSSFAYRKGRSVAQAVQRVASLRRDGYRWALDADIVRYFENIPHDGLLNRLERSVDDVRLTGLIGFWLEHYSPNGKGVPQGSPLSPLLANLYLDALDEAFAGGGMRIVRFADDFVVLCKSEDRAHLARERAAQLLTAHGLELHPDKTRVAPFDESFRFLGHLFVRSLVLKEIIDDPSPPEDAIAAAELATAAAALEDKRAREAGDDLGLPDKQPPPGRFAPRQRTLYVLEPDRTLDASGQAFRVMDAKVAAVELPHRRVDLIVMSAETAVTAAALDLAAATDTEITRVNGHGETLGRWIAPDPGNARLQIAQAKHCLDPVLSVALAKAIVDARIHNQRALLRRLNQNHQLSALTTAAATLSRVYRKLRLKDLTVGTLRGIEGEAASLFWEAYWQAAGSDWSWTRRRKRRPATDPVNIVLNALCAQLERDIRLAVTRAGLHPGFGTLHAEQDDGEALVYDLMEAFRSPIAEALTLALIRRKALRADWFTQRADGSLAMDRQAWKAIIRGYESWVNRPVRDPASGKELLWRGLFAAEAQHFGAHVSGGTPFRAYHMDY